MNNKTEASIAIDYVGRPIVATGGYVPTAMDALRAENERLRKALVAIHENADGARVIAAEALGLPI